MPDHSNSQGTADRAAIDRLNCPSCGMGFAIPKGLDKFKGKRAKCQACAAPFRFAADGLSLITVDATPESPPAGEQVAVAKSVGAHQETFPEIHLDADRPPRDEPVPKRSVVPLAIAAVALVALVPTLWLTLGSSRKEGTIQLELESPVAGVTISVDGKPIALNQLRAPLTLPVGPHRLKASGKDLVPFQGVLPVFEGANQPFLVKLVAAPKTAVVVVTPKPERQLVADDGAEEAVVPKLADGAMEDAGAMPDGMVEPDPAVAGNVMEDEKVEADPNILGDLMPGDKVAADPAVVGNVMEDEKVEADPNILGDLMPGEKVAADPDILGAEPKAGPNANATLKQIAADPESYLDTAVIPSDLLLIDTGTVGGTVGRRSGPLDLHLAVKSREGSYRDSVKPGTTFEILLTSKIADAIRDQIRSSNLVGGEYPAIVKFKITKDATNPTKFVGLVEWVELLVYIDPRHIFNGKTLYNKVFTVIRVADGETQVGLSPSYGEWRKRLAATSVLSKIKKAYHQAFTLNRGVEYDQLALLLRTKLPNNSKMFHTNLMSLFRAR